jgi:3-oxoacyl-[acyl-carrier protein] reductase
MLSLVRKTALVTGGGRGIGRGVALSLAAAGAAVAIVEIDPVHGANVAREISDRGGRALFVPTDVSHKMDVLEAVKRTAQAFGGLDILVNSAIALSPEVPIEEKTDENLAFMLGTGVWPAWWAMRASLPFMKQSGGGRIINFYSNDADSGAWLHSDYNVAKGAVLALTRSAALEWARYNVLVNAICPAAAGFTFERLQATAPDLALAAHKRNPLGRIGDPERDIGPVAVFLASPAASYITGEVIHVDGGQHLPRRDSRPAGL